MGSGPFSRKWVRPLLAFTLILQLALPVLAAPEATLRAGQARGTLVAAGLEDALRFDDPALRDTYDALRTILRRSLGWNRQQVDDLIRQQAKTAGVLPEQLLRGVLDVPDAELPHDEEFGEILHSAEVLFESGGNGGRGLREIARVAEVQAISDVPVDDDGGNYGDWRKFLEGWFDERFVCSLGGDVANVRTVDLKAKRSSMTRQLMADRSPEKPKEGWPQGTTIRGLVVQEIQGAFKSFKEQHRRRNPAKDPQLVRTLATLIGASRILKDAFGDDLLAAGALSKASGQNLLGVAIAIRSGFLNPHGRKVHPERLTRALLLWNRVVGVDGRDGVVIPNSLDGVHPYFVYADRLRFRQSKESGKVRLGESDILREQVFTVTRSGDQLVLTDKLGRRLRYESKQGAYVASKGSAIGAQFRAFPSRVEQAIHRGLDALAAKKKPLAVTLIRGEHNASEETSWYEGSHVLAWGAEYPAGKPPDISRPIKDVYDAIRDGRTKIQTIVIGLGSEGTSIAPHFWRPERVRFFAELARRRKAGQPVPRVVFVFNPAETNDSYNLGPTEIIRNYEMIFREVLHDETVQFQDLIPEIVLCEHPDHLPEWVLARNPAVAEEMGKAPETVDYRHLLGPINRKEHYGLVKKNRRAMPLEASIRADLARRFEPAHLHVGPYADVRGTVLASAGETKRVALVQMLSHRLGIVLFPKRRALLLRTAIREERRMFREKFQRDPADGELAAFLNQVGYHTTTQEIQAISVGLEELPPPTAGSWVEEFPAFLA